MAVLTQESDLIPPSLQCLEKLNRLFVKQKAEGLEVLSGFETKNKFVISNTKGENLLYAAEEINRCSRFCCLGSKRPFDMKILDSYGNEVIHLYRDLACDSCCFPCYLQKLQVFSPPGYLVGTVEQTWSLCTPQFDIKDENGDTVMKIEGPSCRFNYSGSDSEFHISKLDKARVGKISNQWSGLRVVFPVADKFGISFPKNLDIRMKAVMIGACFLIDYMYFGKGNNPALNSLDNVET